MHIGLNGKTIEYCKHHDTYSPYYNHNVHNTRWIYNCYCMASGVFLCSRKHERPTCPG